MSHSSVPSSNAGAAGGPNSFKNMDRIAMYCSYFTYCDKAGEERRQIRDMNKDSYIDQMKKAECKSLHTIIFLTYLLFIFMYSHGSQIRNS